jgi:hypothetical protein
MAKAKPEEKKKAKAKPEVKKAEPKAEAAKPAEKKKGSRPAPDIVIKPKYVKRTVAGLAFWHEKLDVHKGVQAWVDAKCPDNAYVYDTLDNLSTCGIPLCDAKVVNGLAVKTSVKKPQPAQVNIAYAIPSKPPEVKKSINRIQDADTKEHHQMSYG